LSSLNYSALFWSVCCYQSFICRWNAEEEWCC